MIGLARVYVADLGGGDPGYGLLFAAVFGGLALGMWRGPRFLLAMSRPRLFGFSLTAAGVVLAGIALIANLAVVTVAHRRARLLRRNGVDHRLHPARPRGRGRAPRPDVRLRADADPAGAGPRARRWRRCIAGLIGTHRWQINDDAVLDYNGAAITMFGSALRHGRCRPRSPTIT